MAQTEIKKNFQKQKNPLLVRKVSGSLVLLTSILFLLGWLFEQPLLVTLQPGWPAVAPLTALCFFLSGLATLLLSFRPKSGGFGLQAFSLGVGVLLSSLGILIIGRHFYGWEISPDLLNFQSVAQTMSPKVSARMSPATALCFLLSGLWYMLDFLKPRFAIVKILSSFCVLTMSCLIVVAYIYGASSLYQLPLFLKMSILTAFLFAILHLGLLFSEVSFSYNIQSPLSFWRDKNTARERPLYASLLLVFAAFLVAGVAASQGLNRLIHTIDLVSDTQARVDELDQLLDGLLNAESGQRGYLLTGEDDYLKPYFFGFEGHSKNLEALRIWVEDHPEYQEPFAEIEKQSKIKFKELGDTVILFRTKGFEHARKEVKTDLGNRSMAKIRENIALIKNDLVKILAEQRQENQAQVRKTVTSITVGSFFASILLLTCLNLYVKNTLRRSQVEDEVRELNHNLEHKIREVEVVNRELESFSYSVSHDLRAPLRAMSGFGNILLEDHLKTLNPEGQSYLQRIIAAAEKMSRLINGILELSKISRHDLKKENVLLSYVVSQLIEELRQLEPQRQVEVIIEPNLEVSGDALLLGSFLQNLIGNAWKFTAKKEIARIEFGILSPTGKRIYFVRDNGAGFDMAYSEKLFGTFQRLHTEAEYSGTGVGLATARRIVHLHGGEIWADAKVNEGATFYFTLI